MTHVGTPQSRRALRMYVKITGPLMVRGGHTRRVDSRGGFVACEPVFAVGTHIDMELMLNPKNSAGVKVNAQVIALHGHEGGEPGIELRWQSAMTSRSPSALQRFLSTVLGVSDPLIRAHDAGEYRHRYEFPQQGAVSVGSMFEAMKSRPMGKGSRRTVMHTDPNLGPAKLTDVLGTLPASMQAPSVVTPKVSAPEVVVPKVSAPEEHFNISTDTVPEMTHEGLEEEVIEDDLAAYDAPLSRPTPVLAKPVTMRGTTIEDRRQRDRITVAVPVSYFLNSKGTVGRAHNVSRSGLYIETTENPPEVGSRLNVRFPVRHSGTSHVVLLTCLVVRHRAGREKPGTKRGFAVNFLVVDELSRTGIFRHFINQHL